jgi:hydrogenase nickel incorporation protein HypA/HybF
VHELSIAHSLAELAEEAARRAGATRVVALHLAIGQLAGIEPGALEFSWDLAARDTILAGSRLEIRSLPVVVHCPVCAADVELPDMRRFRCPRCQTPSADLRQGRELEITGLEIESPQGAP